MDHWGDPWADDTVADTQPPPDDKVKTPPLVLSSAPVLLNGFLDDAQWGTGDADESFGAWAVSTKEEDVVDSTVPGTRVSDPASSSVANELLDTSEINGTAEKSHFGSNGEGWGNAEDEWESSREPDNVVSEASDSATTVQPDDDHERTSPDPPHPDDDISTRPSTSPSEVSHTEAPTDSPRTSFEDERIARKGAEVDTPPVPESKEDTVEHIEDSGTESKLADSEGSEGDDFGDFEDDLQSGTELHAEKDLRELEAPDESSTSQKEAQDVSTQDGTSIPSVHASPTHIAGLGVDLSLFNQLFPPLKSAEEPSESPDDPVYSTSARKAWYRLTRKQTMREFNTGGDENNYVRVTWTNSRVRSDVLKIISKWATEDRISGHGPSGRHSFFWDQAPKVENNTANTKVRKKSIVSVAAPTQPAIQKSHSLSSDVPAAFSWSSPSSSSQNPWTEDKSEARSVSSPLAAAPITVARVQQQDTRSVSVDLTRSDNLQTSHKKTASLISPPAVDVKEPTFPTFASPTSNASAAPDHWGDLGGLDTTSQSKPADVIEDVDDDWGEMVESPTVSSPNTLDKIPESMGRNEAFSTPTSTPKSVKTSPFQPPLSKHASPIVRLKGTVSPTSALFKHSFVPASVESGPIGPGILKPTTKSANQTPEKLRMESRPPSSMDEILNSNKDEEPIKSDNGFEDVAILEPSAPTARTPDQDDDPDDFSAFESSTPEQQSSSRPVKTAPPYSPPPNQISTDAWGDVDLSTFDSPSKPPPVLNEMTSHNLTAPAPPPTQHSVDPWSGTDFSAFDSPSKPSPSLHNTSQQNSPVPAPPPDTQSTADPWSDADFSIFESAPPPAPPPAAPSYPFVPTAELAPVDLFAIFDAPIEISAAEAASFRREPTRSRSPPIKMPLTGATNLAQRRKAEEDEIVKGIVEGLPDLRYMLRR